MCAACQQSELVQFPTLKTSTIQLQAYAGIELRCPSAAFQCVCENSQRRIIIMLHVWRSPDHPDALVAPLAIVLMRIATAVGAHPAEVAITRPHMCGLHVGRATPSSFCHPPIFFTLRAGTSFTTRPPMPHDFLAYPGPQPIGAWCPAASRLCQFDLEALTPALLNPLPDVDNNLLTTVPHRCLETQVVTCHNRRASHQVLVCRCVPVDHVDLGIDGPFWIVGRVDDNWFIRPYAPNTR